MSKEYHYVIKWSESAGWQIDPDMESAHFPNGTIYDSEQGWQCGYLGEGEYNGKEEQLSETLIGILDLHNSMIGREGK
jgi:hypothetical protein